jgi:hypothetical protein
MKAKLQELNSHIEEEPSSVKVGGTVGNIKHAMNKLNKNYIATNKHLTRDIVKLDSFDLYPNGLNKNIQEMNEVNKLFKKQLKKQNLSIFSKLKEYVSP